MENNRFIVCDYHEGSTESVQMIDKHYHNWLELCYLQSGSGNCLIENKVFSLETGDVMVIPSGRIHRSAYTSKTRARLLINISAHYCPDFVESLVEGTYVYRNPKVCAEVYTIMKTIERECNNRDRFSERLLADEVYRLFVLLARNENRYTNSIALSPCVKAALDYIDSQFNTELTATTVAHAVFVSRSHLSRVFKKETGMGLLQYITTVRMKHAEQLLKDAEIKTVAQIANECGFTDSNYFSWVFKKATGYSPLQYRHLNHPFAQHN